MADDHENERRLMLQFDLRGILEEIKRDVAAIRSEQSITTNRLTKLEGRVDTAEAVAKSKAALIAIMLTLVCALVAVGGLLVTVGKL